MTSEGLEHAMPCPSSASTVVVEIECKARGNPVLSELSQKFDGVLKRCGEGKRAALASFLCGIHSRHHTRVLNEKRQRRAPGRLATGACQHPSIPVHRDAKGYCAT